MSRVACVLLTVALTACGGARPAFDEARARAHIDMLAGTIGSRPTGSPANVRARLYVVAELQRYGFAVRVQETQAVDPRQGITAPVANIIASRDGERSEAIALISHYDSVPEAAGALDTALGVATCLEAARVLVEQPMRHSLFVIITDGEELGLLGARVAVTDPEIAKRVRAFLNFDGTGAAGPMLLFETGPGRGTPLDVWARAAAAPEGASYSTEIYRRLPNDTDFTAFRTLGVPGLNFAPVDDSYAYHTDRDVPSRVQPATLAHGIVNAISTVRALDATDITSTPGVPTYFDLGRLRGVVYGPGVSTTIALAALVLAVIAWLLLTRDVWRAAGAAGTILTALWALLTVVAAFGSMVVAVSALRAVRSELTPWYAAPQGFFAFVALAGAFATWAVGRVAAAVPERGRPWRHPAATWWVTLPVWIVLATVMQRSAPAAAYLAMIPLLAAAVLTLAVRRHATLLRLTSAVVLVIAGFFWIADTLRLLAFLVPLLAWLPLVAPVWLYPAVIAAAGLVVLPPALAALAGLQPRWASVGRVGVALAALVGVTGVSAYRAPAYTPDRPERRAARYVQDVVKGEAWWEIGRLEPELGINGSGPEGARWLRVTDAPAASVILARLNQPIVFRTPSAPLGRTPADVRATFTREPVRSVLELTIVPEENLIARIVLPQDLMPTESTLPGQVSAGRWSTTFVSPPASGLTVKLMFDRWPTAAPPPILVTLTTLGLPGGTGRLRLPAWLPQETATWRARSVYVVGVKAGMK
jgi:hypothetical protein